MQPEESEEEEEASDEEQASDFEAEELGGKKGGKKAARGSAAKRGRKAAAVSEMEGMGWWGSACRLWGRGQLHCGSTMVRLLLPPPLQHLLCHANMSANYISLRLLPSMGCPVQDKDEEGAAAEEEGGAAPMDEDKQPAEDPSSQVGRNDVLTVWQSAQQPRWVAVACRQQRWTRGPAGRPGRQAGWYVPQAVPVARLVEEASSFVALFPRQSRCLPMSCGARWRASLAAWRPQSCGPSPPSPS